jgi:DNA modification methylase
MPFKRTPPRGAICRRMSNVGIQVEYRPVTELKLNPKNSRVHSARQIAQIAKSIKAFGFVSPILTDQYGVIIAGEGRYKAGLNLGLAEVPTIQLGHLSEQQILALMIADNRLTEKSQWDDKLLTEQLRELSLADLAFDIEATGFEIPEIDLRIESPSVENVEADPADELSSRTIGPPVSRLGDLWFAGRHKVLCGNSLDNVSLATLMQLELAAIMFADPPYNVRIQGHVSGLGKIMHRESAMASGEMDEEGFGRFLSTVFALCTRYSVDGAIHFICMDWPHIGELLAAARPTYSELKNMCVWVKNNAGMGAFYRSQHELVFVFKHGKASHRNNIELGRFGRSRTNVWRYPGANSLGRSTEEGNLLELHPTIKPVAMVADAILDCSARGDIVLDPFLGSGTTLLAAERTGRCCRGIEIDPLYVDVAIRRWRVFSGDDATDATTGKTFTAVEAERGLTK